MTEYTIAKQTDVIIRRRSAPRTRVNSGLELVTSEDVPIAGRIIAIGDEAEAELGVGVGATVFVTRYAGTAWKTEQWTGEWLYTMNKDDVIAHVPDPTPADRMEALLMLIPEGHRPEGARLLSEVITDAASSAATAALVAIREFEVEMVEGASAIEPLGLLAE